MADNDDFFNTFKSFSSNLPSNSGKKFIFKKTSNNVTNSKTTGSISKIVTSNTTLKDNSKIQNAGKEISSIHKSELIDKGATEKETDFTVNNVEMKKTLISSPSLKNLKKDLKSRSFLKNVMKRSTTLDSLDAFDLNSSKVSLKKNQTCVKSNKSNTTLNGFLSLKKNFMDGQSEYSPLVTKDNVGIQSKSSQESLNSNTSNESISSTKKFVFKKRDSANAGSSSIVSSDSSIKNIETNMTAFDKIGDDNQAHMGSPHFDKKETWGIFVENTNVEKLNKQNVSSPKFTFRKKTNKSLEASKLPNLSMAIEHSCTIDENKVSSSKFSFTKNVEGSSLPPLGKSKGLQLDDKITSVDDNLKASDGDYMDDEEFERLFGSPNTVSTNSQNSSVVKAADLGDYLDEDINLEDIDWDSDIPVVKKTISEDVSELLEGVDIEDFIDDGKDQLSFSSRVDNSKEFVGNYPHTQVMMEVLHTRFGLRSFRPHQREICNASLTGHDIFVLMPTGGGKSLCYQLPATLTPGVSIVISPLRSLISDQVDKLNALDISSGHLCADQSKEDTDLIMSKLYMREPEIKLLFLTPEKISASRQCSDALDYLYARDKLARFIIDEAHCLSQWGHDFRPDYKQLSCLRVKYPKVAIICLTATATKQVEGDVINILKLRNVKTFIRSFNRPNIKYKVIPKSKANVIDEIALLIKRKFFKQSGIIYCLSRDDCERAADELKRNGIQAMPYHAGMSTKVRDAVQRQWMQDRFHVIVGTIAFGMGIDKPDVRFVIHNSIPKSVEAFYQESGRAGRDGETSYSYLYYGYNDVKRLQRIMMMEKSNPSALSGHFEALKQMVSYCENHADCRRYLQLIHLGETFDRQICIRNKETTCDNCEQSSNYSQVNVSEQAKNLCQLIKDFTTKGDKVTISQVADVYKGSKAKKLLERRHDKHPYYAKGSSMDRTDIQRILKQLLVKDILSERCEYAAGFPVVYVNPGRSFSLVTSPNFQLCISVNTKKQVTAPASCRSPKEIPAIRSATITIPDSPVASTSKVSDSTAPKKHEISQIRVRCHEDLLEECRRLALEKNMTLSSIMNLSAIKKMSDVLPKTKDEMMKIQHVTAANYEKYGEFFLKITMKHRAKMDALKAVVERPKTVVSATSKSSSLVEDDDWWYDSSQPSQSSSGANGLKRKYYGGYKKGAKRFRGSGGGGRRTKKGSKGGTKSGKAKASTMKKTTSKGLGLMPVMHIS